MKKKLYYLVMLIASASFMASCYADEGNYNYLSDEEVMPVEIISLRDTTVVLYSTLYHEPEVKGLVNKDDYQYAWYTSLGDTLSTEYALNGLFIDFKTGDHKVFYSIKNKSNGVAVIADWVMSVTVSYNNGWYLLREHNGESDLDFIFNSDGTVETDILSKANGFRMEGAPSRIVYQLNGYGYTSEDENGEMKARTNISALHLMSASDFVSLDPVTMKKYYRGNEAFYFDPDRIAPGNWRYDTQFSMMGISMVNDGKLYSIRMRNDYTSRFAYPVGHGEDYFAWDDFIYMSLSGILIFDTKKECFMYAEHGYQELIRFYDTGESPSPRDMNHKMVNFLSRVNEGSIMTPGTAYALMQDNQTGDYRIFDISFTSYSTNLFKGIFDVPAGSKLPHAKCMSAHITSSAIYFSEGDNNLYIHNVTSSNDLSIRERVVIEYPSDEKIVFMNQEKVGGTTGTFVVVTQKGGNWKLYEYAFKGATTEFEDDLLTEYEGEGKVGFALKVK